MHVHGIFEFSTASATSCDVTATPGDAQRQQDEHGQLVHCYIKEQGGPKREEAGDGGDGSRQGPTSFELYQLQSAQNQGYRGRESLNL